MHAREKEGELVRRERGGGSFWFQSGSSKEGENLDAIMGPLDANRVGQMMQELRDVFATGKTRSVEWRLEQLNGIVRLLDQKTPEILEAMSNDIRKPAFETKREMNSVRVSAKLMAANIAEWMQPETVTSGMRFMENAAIIPEPLGVVLIISTWNFPLALSMDPVIAAISAGNCVVLKPSELAPATSDALAQLLPLYLDPSAVRVVEGGIPEATALLEQRWDKILYTGSAMVGKIVMAAAAMHVTPVILELGGKSPTIVDSTADLEVTARRITWGKWTMTNGQCCLAPDYVLVEESIRTELINQIKETLKQFYGEEPFDSPNISRMVNKSAFQRLNSYLNDEAVAEKVIYGGQRNEEALYIAPTMILDPPLDSPIMQDEIFGPLLVIITVKNVAGAVRIVNSRPKPLALYLFSNDQRVVEQVLQETSSGGVAVNDTILHCGHHGLPFGGVGQSGMGSYHGKYSFDAFSHKKSVLYGKLTDDIAARYPSHV